MTQAQLEEIAHLEQLISTYTRRLRLLREQLARYDSRTLPPEKLLEQDDIERELKRLGDQLRRLRPALAEGRTPYLGLTTFQERDAELFFGREALVGEL